MMNFSHEENFLVVAQGQQNQRKEMLTNAVTESEESSLRQLGRGLKNGHPLCMKIKNLSEFPMTDGCVAPKCGIIHSALSDCIAPNSVEYVGFQKTPMSLYGTVGVVAYNVGDYKLCIMYGNPFTGRNKGALGWYSQSKRIYEELADEMIHEGYFFQGRGTMRWTPCSSPDGEIIAEGFVSQGDPAYLHVHVRNA